MLEQLFGSKTRTKLLKIFLLNPEEIYYIRELTRMIDTQINSVRRELDNLVQCGVARAVPSTDPKVIALEEKEQAGAPHKKQVNDKEKKEKGQRKKETQPKKYFAVNKDFVLHGELYQLLIKSPLLFQKKFISDLQTLETVDFAMITGFLMQISNTPVDLLLVGDVPKNRLSKIISFYEREFEREIIYTTMTTDEFLYRKSLTDRFLFKILDSKKIIVIDRLGVNQA